MTIKKYFI